MRPTEGSSMNILEIEASPSEFLKDFGVMLVEGRIPELSVQGRKPGIHSWPLTRHSMKKCCFNGVNKEMCNLVSTTRANITSMSPTKTLIFEVYALPKSVDNVLGQKSQTRVHITKNVSSDMLLIEKWKVKTVLKSNLSDHVSVSMAFQAIRSFLHFSQLSAWWNVSQGTFPATVYFKISLDGESESTALSQKHVFPPIEISKNECIELTVLFLPRMCMSDLQFNLKQQKNRLTFDGGGVESKKRSLEIPVFKNCNSSSKHTDSNDEAASSLPSSSKRKDPEIDEYFSQHLRTRNCQTTCYVGEKILKLACDNADSNVLKNSDGATVSSSSSRTSENDFKSSNISQVDSETNPTCNLVRKSGLSNLLEQGSEISKVSSKSNFLRQRSSNEIENLLENFVIDSKLADQYESSDEEEDEEEEEEENLENKDLDNAFEPEKITPPRLDDCTSLNRNLNPSFQRIRSKSVSPQCFGKRKDENHNISSNSKPLAARRLAMVAGTVPVFNPKTGLPMSSSPAPIKKARIISESSGGSLSRSSSFEDLKPTCFGLSKSAPPATGLLGNFEESVLKGRMPVHGTLEGFRTELSASGSFCPKHVTLPIKVQHFNLSDDNTPSPYLGKISLRDKRLKKRKYKVPRKGTVQLTIFNPNNTVVKVFVVRYDLEDMPSLTKTFVRQRMVSSRKDPRTLADVQVVHYLIHLSFMSSRHSHIYLHSDILIMFPQQTPDRTLLTISDSPTNPKYTAMNRRCYINIDDDDV